MSGNGTLGTGNSPFMSETWIGNGPMKFRLGQALGDWAELLCLKAKTLAWLAVRLHLASLVSAPVRRVCRAPTLARTRAAPQRQA